MTIRLSFQVVISLLLVAAACAPSKSQEEHFREEKESIEGTSDVRLTGLPQGHNVEGRGALQVCANLHESCNINIPCCDSGLHCGGVCRRPVDTSKDGKSGLKLSSNRMPTKPDRVRGSHTPPNADDKLPSTSPPPPVTPATYIPGQLTVSERGLLLSEGLTVRIIGRTNVTVKYDEGRGRSKIPFQQFPDFGATFVDPRPNNPGGWIYVINSEVRVGARGRAGVGALTFDRDGNLFDYRMLLEGTTANCGGGRAPWGAWISCEEYRQGNIWQVDPTGVRPAKRITLGKEGGLFESFAYDVRSLIEPHFFVTEDHLTGPVWRFTPSSPNWTDPWSILYGEGVTDYLLMHPDKGYETGQYEWTINKASAKNNAQWYYPNCEGIDAYEHELYFVSKRLKRMFILNLNDGTYRNITTRHGLFNGAPDQLKRIINDKDELLYFTEEGSKRHGIHARNNQGQFFTILESLSFLQDESTGLSFSPDGRFLYFAFQKLGRLYEVKRTDGLPFQERTLNVKYHAAS